MKQLIILLRKPKVFRKLADVIKYELEKIHQNIIIKIINKCDIITTYNSDDNVYMFFFDYALYHFRQSKSKQIDCCFNYIFYMHDNIEWNINNELSNFINNIIQQSKQTYFYDSNVLSKYSNVYNAENILYVPYLYSKLYESEYNKNKSDDKNVIDILFFGRLNDRRKEILSKFKKQIVETKYKYIETYDSMDNIDKLLHRTKIVIIINTADNSAFDMHRIIPLLIKKKFVLMEYSSNDEMNELFKDKVVMSEINKLFDTCCYFLNNMNKTEIYITNSYKYIRDHNYNNVLLNNITIHTSRIALCISGAIRNGGFTFPYIKKNLIDIYIIQILSFLHIKIRIKISIRI